MKSRKINKATKKLTNRRRTANVFIEKREEALKKLTELDQELKLYGEDLEDN